MKNILLSAATAIALISLSGAAEAASTFGIQYGGTTVSGATNNFNFSNVTTTEGGRTYTISSIDASYSESVGATELFQMQLDLSNIKRTVGTGTGTLTVVLSANGLTENQLPTF